MIFSTEHGDTRAPIPLEDNQKVDSSSVVCAKYKLTEKSVDNQILNDFFPEQKSFLDVQDIFVPFMVWVLLVMCISISSITANNHVCSHKIPISSIIISTEYGCFFAFATNILTALLKMITVLSSENLSKKALIKKQCYILVISIVSACSISYHWLFSLNVDFICVDAMGVPSFVIQWCEWLAVVPLLAYIACMIDKSKFTKNDYFAIASAILMILFGCASAVAGAHGLDYLSIVFYVFSCGFFVVKVKYMLSTSDFNIMNNGVSPLSDIEQDILVLQAKSRKQKGLLLSCFFFLFPLVHALRWTGAITHDETLCAFMITSTFTKIGLCCALIECYSDFTANIAKLSTFARAEIIHEQTQINDRNEVEINTLNQFRNVLANTAHDLKTPLAGFSGGVDIIEQELIELKKVLFCLLKADAARSSISTELARFQHHLANVEECVNDVKSITSINKRILDPDEEEKLSCENESRNVIGLKESKDSLWSNKINPQNKMNDENFKSDKSASKFKALKKNVSFRLKDSVKFPHKEYAELNKSLDDAEQLNLISKIRSNAFSVSNDRDFQMGTIQDTKSVEDTMNSSTKDSMTSVVDAGNVLENITTVLSCDWTISNENGLNVLLVDDSDMIRKVVTKKLTKAGYNVDYAENGSVAVDKVIKSMQSNDAKCKYDLIIMDLQMPVMDGLEATRRIREYESSFFCNSINNNDNNQSQNMHAIIIGCSANVDSSVSNLHQYPGMDFILDKPLDMNKLGGLSSFLKV
eukprot:gene11443-15330_t